MRDEDEPLAMEAILGTPPAAAAGTGDLKTLSRILGVAVRITGVGERWTGLEHALDAG